MGRPSKLTAELTDEICESLALGAPVETAAEAAGIDHATLYRWIDRGIRGEEPYAALCEAVMRARAKAELDLLRSAAAGDEKGVSYGQARAACWLLERTRPTKYGQRINLKLEEAVSEVLEVVRGVCSPEDFARICERLEARDRQGGEGIPAGVAGDDSDSPVH